jgi:hypothetical protein
VPNRERYHDIRGLLIKVRFEWENFKMVFFDVQVLNTGQIILFEINLIYKHIIIETLDIKVGN